MYPKRINTFQLISHKKHSLPLSSVVLLLVGLVDKYSQLSWIFQQGRRFNVTDYIILNWMNTHKLFDSYYVQEKLGNVFLKYSQKSDYCFSCGRVLFTMFSLQIIPIFLCLHSYTNKNHSLKSFKWPHECGFGLFFGGRYLKGRLFHLCLCACANVCTRACMSL